MRHAKAHAKINLGLVVGPLRGDGKHEVVTILQRVELHDDVSLESAGEVAVEGFADDTIVAAALRAIARAACVEPGWHVRIEKRIPVAAGLGGGSADAAAALELANQTLAAPLSRDELHAVAAELGADVPFFLGQGPQLATGDGTELEPVDLPRDYHVVLLVPDGAEKESTRAVYDDFDRRTGNAGAFAERRSSFSHVLASVAAARDLGGLPSNDLASSPIADDLIGAGAFRADVSGAGPAVYGLFESADTASRAEEALRSRGRTFVTRPV